MDELSQIISDSTRSIDRAYFSLNIAGGDRVYRERVYCYELYHQMRVRWPANTPYLLNGEVDKRAHPILTEIGVRAAKPDLLVHQPGDMNGNHAVIEVKHSNGNSAGLRKDLESLTLFEKLVGYRRAILLIYGDGADNAVVNRIDRIVTRLDELAPIELWLHQSVGSPAIHLKNLKPAVHVG